MKNIIKKAKGHLKKAREIIAKSKSPFTNMKEEDVIKKIRRDRKRIWEARIAPGS